MSKKNFFTFIIVILIVALALWGIFAFLKSRSAVPGEEGGGNFFSRFNPLPQRPTPTPPSEEPQIPETPIDTTAVRLRKISSMPVAGYGVFQKERFKEIAPISAEISTKPTPPETEFYPSVRYVARENGHIYQTFADKLSERRFSATLVPKVYEAHFGNNGEAVIMRYLKADEKTIVTFTGNLPKEKLGDDALVETEISGSFLPEDISDLVVSPDTSRVFYLLPTGTSVAGITAGIGGDKKNQVMDSAFTEWLPQWSKLSMVMLTTKPSAKVPGHLYSLDTDRKELRRVFGDINGLTTLTSPDGKLVLYGDSSANLYLYDIASGKAESLAVKTLPDKCVWGASNEVLYCSVPKFVSSEEFPDAWYKGQVSFSDEIWKIDIATKNTERISELVSASAFEDMDNIKLTLDKSEGYLFFINKKDGMLWELILK